jgi:hypothetical protein
MPVSIGIFNKPVEEATRLIIADIEEYYGSDTVDALIHAYISEDNVYEWNGAFNDILETLFDKSELETLKTFGGDEWFDYLCELSSELYMPFLRYINSIMRRCDDLPFELMEDEEGNDLIFYRREVSGEEAIYISCNNSRVFKINKEGELEDIGEYDWDEKWLYP